MDMFFDFCSHHNDLLIVYGLELLGLFCVWRIWRKPGSKIYKAIWSLLVMAPLIGPLGYFTFYDPPEEKPDGDQGRPTPGSHHGV